MRLTLTEIWSGSLTVVDREYFQFKWIYVHVWQIIMLRLKCKISGNLNIFIRPMPKADNELSVLGALLLSNRNHDDNMIKFDFFEKWKVESKQ